MKEYEDCTKNNDYVSPFVKGYVRRLLTDIPEFVESLVVFGSSVRLGAFGPNSDLDLVLSVTDEDHVYEHHSRELTDYLARLSTMPNDVLILTHEKFVEYMGNGNTGNRLYKDIWNEGIPVYVSKRAQGRIPKSQRGGQ